MHVLERRFLQPGAKFVLECPVDRLVVESVLYQIFQLEMGFWSDVTGRGLAYQFDLRFWLKCEGLLRESSTTPGPIDASTSPVLGIPMAIYKLMLMTRRLWTMSPRPPDFSNSLKQVETELASWEWYELLGPENDNSLASCQSPMPTSSHSLVGHATLIMVTCASLLLHQLRGQARNAPSPPDDEEGGKMVDKIISILRSRKGDHQWTSCHVATYPIYVAGYFMRSEEEINLVKAEMQQRFEDLHWRQVSRFWEDLETVWRTTARSDSIAH